MAACQPGTCCCECHGCSGVRKVYKMTEQHFRGCFLEFNNLVSRVSCDRRQRRPFGMGRCDTLCACTQIGHNVHLSRTPAAGHIVK